MATGKDCDRIAWWKQLRSRGPRDRSLRGMLFILSSWMSPDGAECYPAQDLIATATLMSPKTVQRLIARARRLGWLRAWRVNVPGTRKSVLHYHASLPTSDSEQPRRAAVLIPRGKGGRFRRTTPLARAINTAGQSISTPLGSGHTSPLREPLPHHKRSLQEKDPPEEDQQLSRAKDQAIKLAAKGMDAATITGLLYRLEVSQQLVEEWIRDYP